MPALACSGQSHHGQQSDLRARRRRHLVAAAIDVWGTTGYSSLTISSLAHHVEASTGSIRSHLSSHDDLIRACVDTARKTIVLDPSGRMGAARDIDELVETFVGSLGSSMREDASLHRMRYDLQAQSMFDGGLAAAAQSVQAAWMSGIDGFVARVQSLSGSAPQDVVMGLAIEDMFARSMQRHTFGDVDAVAAFEADLRIYLRYTLGSRVV